MTATRHTFAVIAPPTPGHYNPLQVLGMELVRLGHQVTFVHQAEAATLVGSPALQFRSVDGGAPSLRDYYTTLESPTGFGGLRRMIRATAAISDRLLRAAPAVLREMKATAVIADSAEPAGAVLAGALDLPCAISVTGLPLLGEPNVPPPFLGWRYRPDALGRFRNRGGYYVSERLMRPITRTLARHDRSGGDQSAMHGKVHVAQCPQALDYPRTQLPLHFHYCGPWRGDTPNGLDLPDDGRPLVFCSLGTLQGGREALFATMARACADIGARAVIGHGGGLTAAQAAALPGDPLVRAFWPQQQLLRKCSAAILHGGFNSVLDALAAGVPIVALPIAFEQPGTAARLKWLGAGEILSRSTSSRALSRTLQTVMRQPRYRHAAETLAAEMQGAGGAVAAAAAIDQALA